MPHLVRFAEPHQHPTVSQMTQQLLESGGILELIWLFKRSTLMKPDGTTFDGQITRAVRV